MKHFFTISLFLFCITTVQAQEPYIGEIRMFAGNFAPRGWAFCNGQILPISQNTALFSLLGTTYGGDGRTSFALPDLRSRTPIHAGQGPGLSNYQLGQKGGNETITLSQNQLPAHSHVAKLNVNNDEASSDDPENNYLAVSGENMYSPTTNALGADATINVESTGNNAPINITTPYVTINYIIALTGTFPSR